MSFKIFKGQSALRLTLETFIDLESVNAAYVKYKKPDKSAGRWTAGISDVSNGKIYHEFLENEIDQSGWWVFWAFIEFADGRCAAGEPVRVFVWNEGAA